jgi:hypothetical protein
MGRRRQYATNAARQAAYRQRRREERPEHARRRDQQAAELASALRELQDALRAVAPFQPELGALLELSPPDLLRALARNLSQRRPPSSPGRPPGGFLRVEG